MIIKLELCENEIKRIVARYMRDRQSEEIDIDNVSFSVKEAEYGIGFVVTCEITKNVEVEKEWQQ